MVRLRSFFGLAAALSWVPIAAGADTTRAAVVIEKDTVAHSQVVAVGRGLEVDGEVRANAAALGGPITIRGRVDGDVVGLGGDVRLENGAIVTGDVFSLGGAVDVAGGSISGRTVSLPDVSPAWLVLAEGPMMGLSPFSPVVIGAKLALLVAWLVVAFVLITTAPVAVASTSRSVAEEPLRNLWVGIVAVVALLLLVLLFASFLDALVGVPLVVVAVLAAFVLKLWGATAIFAWLGSVLRRRSGTREVAVNALMGLAVLGLLKLLPWIGVWVWTAASLVGMGATLVTKFGQRRPWFENELSGRARSGQRY